MTIILYDIAAAVPNSAWAPNPWKARAVLNFKGIPYRTEWVEFPDIAPLSKKLALKPTSHNDKGNPNYTLPAIHDPSTGVYISDSLAIAEYLEKTYPNAPSVFPNETLGLQHAFGPTFSQCISPVFRFILPVVGTKLSPIGQEYFRRTREAFFGKKLEEIPPTGDERIEEWGKLQKGFDKLHSYLVLTDDKGPFFLGDTISWSDLVVFSWLHWFKLMWGEDSKEWKDIASWNGGRWEAHHKALKKYDTVV